MSLTRSSLPLSLRQFNRYFLFLGCTGIAFIMGLIPYLQEFVFLVGTALLGCIAFVLGIDCYTTANLKEFFVYNLGFGAIFPRLQGRFTITSAMQIELGVILLVFFISVAAQIRLYNLFEKKLSVIMRKAKQEEQVTAEAKAANRIAGVMEKDVGKFEHRYSKGFPFASPTVIYSTQFAHQVPGTPKFESTPLLPELAYRTHRPTSSAAEATGRRLSAYVRGIVGAGSDRERLPSDASDLPSDLHPVNAFKQPSEGLLKDILEKEKALEEIARLREQIGAERLSLRPSTAGTVSPLAESIAFPEAVLGSAGPQAAACQHGRSHSLTIDAMRATALLPVKRALPASVPRPISQYSIVTTQAPVAPRPLPPSPSALPMLQFDAPTPAPTSGLNYHNRTRSHCTLLGRSPSSNTISGGNFVPQRVITGALPSRPSSTSLQSAVMPRTQTMDIEELQARHRRKLSQIQSGSRNSLVVAAGDSVSVQSPVIPSASISNSPRKRSSSAAGLNTFDNSRRLSHGARHFMSINEFGQMRGATAGQTGSKRSARTGSYARPGTGLSMPVIHDAISPLIEAEPAKSHSESRPNDWLTY